MGCYRWYLVFRCERCGDTFLVLARGWVAVPEVPSDAYSQGALVLYHHADLNAKHPCTVGLGEGSRKTASAAAGVGKLIGAELVYEEGKDG